ncbi:hypothetical protein HNY73_013828 [Argiope bruennichi]|uniref:Uncharacterized protein n=1 Tax=Argiope bruennichi TaxID=94029 RepID=A0A8T0EM55_ARGBR|nr:hypothetical protein HNY73_013828 [Argiope bruennichi]
MATAEDGNACCFRWIIVNPFVPWRKMEAVFYCGSPGVTQWRVTIQPIDRRVSYWAFSFCLEFDVWFDGRYEIVADKLLVVIRLNGDLVKQEEISHYSFNSGNKYQYYLETYTTMPSSMVPHLLFIRIQISLPGLEAVNQESNELVFNRYDLERLSADLRNLIRWRYFPDMILVSAADPRSRVPAHSYILDVRWDNFFRLHHFDALAHTTVQANISVRLLMNILSYMYTGQKPASWPDWGETSYFPELFQVIDRYKLYHLYKVFVKRDLNQVRVTRNSVFTDSRAFSIKRVNGRHINDASYTWYIFQRPGYGFIFRIHVRNRNGAGPWLSYSLKSNCLFRVFTQVYLELVKRTAMPGNPRVTFRRVQLFHERDYTMDENEHVYSGPILFLGCPETFGGSSPTRRSETGRDDRLWFNSTLNFSDGITTYQIRSLDDTLPPLSESLHVLSGHMHELRKLKIGADLQVLSPSINRLPEHRDCVHKGILVARVPRWQPTFENAPREIVETVRCTLVGEALSYVLDYIYTECKIAAALWRGPAPRLFQAQPRVQMGLYINNMTDIWWHVYVPKNNCNV